MRLFFSFICLCAPFLTEAQHTFGSALQQGDSLLVETAYYEASIAYERAFYLAKPGTEKATAALRKANTYKKLNQPEAGLKNLDRVPLLLLSDSLRFQLKYESALLAFLSRSYSVADLHLKQLNHFTKNQELKAQVKFLEVLVLNGLQKFDVARDSLTALIQRLPYTPDQQAQLLEQVAELYHKRNIPKIKKPERADVYSSFVPGAGQIYAGYPGEGIASFMLAAGSLGYMAFNAFVLQTYFTTFTAGSSLFVTFYFGGKRRAAYLAFTHNEEALAEFNQEVESFVVTTVSPHLKQ